MVLVLLRLVLVAVLMVVLETLVLDLLVAKMRIKMTKLHWHYVKKMMMTLRSMMLKLIGAYRLCFCLGIRGRCFIFYHV